MAKLLLGSISYCTGADPRTESRIKTHQAQLRWLESVGFEDYIYYRVEQAYTPEFKSAVETSLNLQSLVFEKGLGPAGARNELLKRLYDSDADWLICMDDDRVLYQHYGANNFLKELSINPATVQLAKEGTLVVGVCPARRPFKKNNTDFGKVATHWNLIKGCIDGCLQIACIPNLVKYGYKPVWFNAENDCFHGIPEDIEFEINWIYAKHPMALNLMMVVRDIAPQTQAVSTIYETPEIRRQYEESWMGSADRDYIRKKTRNRISSLAEFNRLKNGFKPKAVPRITPYVPVQSDYGKYKII